MMKYFQLFDRFSDLSLTRRSGLIETIFDRFESYLLQRKMSEATYRPRESTLGSFDLITPDMIKNYDVCIIDAQQSDLYRKIIRLAGQAKSITFCSDIEPMIAKYLNQTTTDVIFILNIDIFDGVDIAINLLLEIRPQLPRAAFVICSKQFSTNDFSKQRISIADTSLRLPCSDAALAIAIEGAIRNKGCNEA